MKVSPVKEKKTTLLFILIFSFIFLILLSTGKRGFYRQMQIHQRRIRLDKEIKGLESLKIYLEEERKKLDDPKVIEEIARLKYGMARKNEVVYHVVPKEK